MWIIVGVEYACWHVKIRVKLVRVAESVAMRCVSARVHPSVSKCAVPSMEVFSTVLLATQRHFRALHDDWLDVLGIIGESSCS